MKRLGRRALALVSILTLCAATLTALTVGTASAGGSGTTSSTSTVLGTVGNVTVSPYQNLSTPQDLTVTVTNIHGSTAGAAGDMTGQTVAVTLCGNANSASVYAPDFATITAGAGYCENAAVGSTLRLIGPLASSDFTTPLTFATSGLGSGGGKCLPRLVGGQPCYVQLADVGTQGGTNPGVGATSFRMFIPVYAAGSAAAPTLATTAVTNQSNASAGRSGNVITLGGANWQTTSSNFTVRLCADAAGASCDAAFTTQSATADGSNNLGGSATIPAGATPGSRFLVVSNTNGDLAAQPFLVLGTPTVSLSPNVGGPGTPVTVSGTNWDTGRPLNAFPTTSGTPIGPISTGAANSSGNIAAGLVVTVNNPATLGIAVTQGLLASPDLFPGTAIPIAGGTAFTFSSTSCIPADPGPDANAATTDGCSLLQTISETVTGSTLTFSEAGSNVALSGITLNGTDQTATGSIQPLTVKDARGSLAGWTVIATMGNLTDGSPGATPANHHAIPSGNLGTSSVACAPQGANTGVASDVSAGAGGALDPTTAITLCTATTGGGGGTFVITSNLSLLVPASVAAGNYTATMTFLVT